MTTNVAVDDALSTATFADDIVAGLQRTAKSISAKWFYDVEGSRLFEAITRLPEYYLTNAELAILRDNGGEVAQMCGPEVVVIEYGSGSSSKTRLLLDRLEMPVAYVPVDIACETLATGAAAIRAAYPTLMVAPICADYSKPISLPELAPHRRRVAFFPGSTIGNFEPDEAVGFLSGVAEAVRPDGGLILGVDLKKDRATLEAAYNDAQGVTAAFNRNVLTRINRELGADFRPDDFRHVAFFDEERGRIEMHLESRIEQVVHVCGRQIVFRAGERIHTENSYKFSLQDVDDVCLRAGFRLVAHWTDDLHRFGVVYLTLST